MVTTRPAVMNGHNAIALTSQGDRELRESYFKPVSGAAYHGNFYMHPDSLSPDCHAGQRMGGAAAPRKVGLRRDSSKWKRIYRLRRIVNDFLPNLLIFRCGEFPNSNQGGIAERINSLGDADFVHQIDHARDAAGAVQAKLLLVERPHIPA